MTLFSVSVYANNWHKVAEENGNSIYIDLDNIKKHRGYVYYSELIDFKEAIYGALSRVSKFKADCNRREKSNLSIISYTGQMGKFFVINEAQNDGKRFFDASKSAVMKFACERSD